MAPSSRWLAFSSEVLLVLGTGLLVYMARTRTALTLLGPRGIRRAAARERSWLFRLADPWLHVLSLVVAQLKLPRLRARLDLLLLRSGNGFGLNADELLAASVFSAVAWMPALVSALYQSESAATWYASARVMVGALTPWFLVRRHALARQKRVGRELPEAIDLVALCMSAGLDFGSALQLWLERSAEQDSPLTDELANMARGLAMGQTRSAMLRELAHAVPSAAVVDFVNAVVQAEQKGTPLAVVIETQAHTLRLRRSQAAEQAAAIAAVWLLLPLLLLLGAIMLVLFAPFIINGAGL